MNQLCRFLDGLRIDRGINVNVFIQAIRPSVDQEKKDSIDVFLIKAKKNFAIF